MKRDGVTFYERIGAIDDYSKNQEKKDLEAYRHFINTSFLMS